MGDDEKRARELLAAAEKQPKTGFFRSLLGGHSDASEEKAGLYEQAANCFKVAKKWQEAGDAFMKAAELTASNKPPLDSANHFVNASVAYRKVDQQRAISCLARAADLYVGMGRFTIAARHHMTIGEIYDDDLKNPEAACKHFQQAADFYQGEESSSSARKCLLKVADLYALAGKYSEAAKIFEETGTASMDNKLLRYGAKEYLMKAVICAMNHDIVQGHNMLEHFERDYPMFADARECTLLKQLDEALNNEDVEAFTTAVKNHDSVTRLDPWMTDMLLKLKKTLADEEDIT